MSGQVLLFNRKICYKQFVCRNKTLLGNNYINKNKKQPTSINNSEVESLQCSLLLVIYINGKNSSRAKDE